MVATISVRRLRHLGGKYIEMKREAGNNRVLRKQR